jgi:hypothetical protein
MKRTTLLLGVVTVLTHAALLFTPSVYGQPSDLPLSRYWHPDGPVSSLVVTNGKTYLGGTFSYVGPDSGAAGVIDLTTGAARRGFPKIEGTVSAAAPDGNGGWYIGGSFTNVGSVMRSNLVHILANNVVDPIWNPQANNNCRVIVVSGGTVYVGGSFTRIGGQTRNRIASLDAVTGTVATDWNPNAGGIVTDISIAGTNVYVAGNFTTIGGQTRNRIAALSTVTGLATAWNPSATAQVNALALDGNTVYAGGTFTTIGGQPRNRIAALDATTGLATDWNPNIPSGGVSNLVVVGNVVYVAGGFTSAGSLLRNSIAAIDKTIPAANATAWDPNASSNVLALLVISNTVYAGGFFTNIGGAARTYIAALDTNSGTALPWAPAASGLIPSIVPSVQVLRAWGNDLLVGGSFASIGGVLRDNIAAVDNASGEATDWNPDASGPVSALAFAGNTVYAGGSFTNIGGQARNRLAALSVTDGTALFWNPDVRGRSGVAVLALAPSATDMFVGAINTTNVGGFNRTNLFAVSLFSGATTAWNPPALRSATAGSVNSIFLSSNTVFVGGDFISIGGQNRTNVAAVDADFGTVQGWLPNANGVVAAVAVSSNVAFAGGLFSFIGGQTRSRIAAMDATSGAASLWNGDASGTGAKVNGLALGSVSLYVGGQFGVLGGAFRTNLASLKQSNGQATAWNPICDAAVRTVVSAENAIFVGGDFTAVGGQTHPYFAVFSAQPQILLESVAINSGQFQFTIQSGEGSQLIVERSPNLTNWTAISTNPITGSPIPFTDPEPVGTQSRFYRARFSLTP